MPTETEIELSAPVACPWCGASLGPDSERRPGRICCSGCGAATTSPWPSDEDLDRAYEHYRPPTGRFSGPGDRLLSALRARLARRIDDIAPPGPILDVGSGDGTLIRALRRRGRETVGIEREPGDGVVATDVRELEGHWAAVVFWHSLEHLREPGAVFEHAADHLLPQGVIVLAAPNAASLQARAFDDRWLGLDVPRHLVHLPLGAIKDRAQALGLELGRISHLRGGQVVFGWLHGLVGLLPGQPALYDAIRRPQARSAPLPPARRAVALAAATALLPVAAVLALTEAALQRGGSFYVELRRA